MYAPPGNVYSSGAGKIQESRFSILKNAGEKKAQNMDLAGPQPISSKHQALVDVEIPKFQVLDCGSSCHWFIY